MIKEILKEKEPLVYASLYNDLKNDKLSHSYLFCGEKNPFKKEVAILLAQSIIEGNNDYADEDSDTSIRIRQNNHLDVMVLDGDEGLIKVDDINHLMEELSKTSLEASIKKVYIINNVNNSHIAALNKILKFMEEPSNENTFGIFISDDVDNLLPTIVSRCQRLDFRHVDYSDIKDKYLNKGLDLIDSYLLSEIYHEYYEELPEEYLPSKDLLFTVSRLDDINNLPNIFYKEVYPQKDFKNIIELFIKMIIKVLNDSLISNYLGDEEYDKLLNIYHKDSLSLLEIYMDGQRVLDNTPQVDRKLLIDQICYKIIKYMRQNKYE